MSAPHLLVVDAANVVGSRPNGWWRDRAKAAANFCQQVADAIESGRVNSPVVVILEGAARKGTAEGENNGMRVVHASGQGDDTIIEVVEEAVAEGCDVRVVTADRELRDRLTRAGAEVLGPKWLLDRL